MLDKFSALAIMLGHFLMLGSFDASQPFDAGHTLPFDAG